MNRPKSVTETIAPISDHLEKMKPAPVGGPLQSGSCFERTRPSAFGRKLLLELFAFYWLERPLSVRVDI